MELRHLRYLVAIADAGTFVRAAELLRVAQPALTRQIHDLEKELGVELFDPSARKATLTVPGQACVRLARHVIHDTQAAVARARLASKGRAGRCVVATGPLPLLSGFVPALVARLKVRHPRITLQIREESAPPQWDSVANGLADIGLGVAPPKGKYPALAVELQHLHTVNVAVVSPEHPLARRERIGLEDLRGYQLLTFERTGTELDQLTEETVAELKRRKFEPWKPREFPTVESVYAHVRAGQGWTLAAPAMRGMIAPLVGVTIDDFKLPLRNVRVWRRIDKRPVVQTVLEELRQMQLEQDAEAQQGGVALPGTGEFQIVPPRLELRHLRSFADLAKYGSIGRAAESIGLTQPALSRQMKDLEYDVGVDLLERGTRGVELSAAGHTFLTDIRSILAVIDHMPREIQRTKRGAAQRCVIGVVPHPQVETIVIRALADLESRGTRVRVGTRMIGTPFQEQALERGEIDIAVGFAYPTQVPPSDFANRMRLFDDELSLALLATNHPLASAAELSLADLRDIPFIFAGRETFPALYDVIFHTFSVAGFRPRIEGEYEGLHTIQAMTAQGLGWALGLRQEMRTLPHGVVAIPLCDFRLPWGAELVYRKDESRSAILAAIDAITASARQLFPLPVSAEEAILPPSTPGHSSQAGIP